MSRINESQQAMTEQRPSKELSALKQYHAEIVEIDGGECEAMRLTRWAIDEIERLNRELADLETRAIALALQPLKVTCESCLRLRTTLGGLSPASLRVAFELWCSNYCSPGAHSSDWYWQLFKGGAEAALGGAAQQQAPPGDGQ